MSDSIIKLIEFLQRERDTIGDIILGVQRGDRYGKVIDGSMVDTTELDLVHYREKLKKLNFISKN